MKKMKKGSTLMDEEATLYFEAKLKNAEKTTRTFKDSTAIYIKKEWYVVDDINEPLYIERLN